MGNYGLSWDYVGVNAFTPAAARPRGLTVRQLLINGGCA
jgi:hypothetical protein